MSNQLAGDSTRERDLEQLLVDFTEKIRAEWSEKWTAHGAQFVGVEGLPSKNAFYHDLADALNETCKQRYGLTAAAAKEIKVHTVRRVLEQGTDRNFDDKTCDSLAVYLGYANWAAYRMRGQLPVPPTPRFRPKKPTWLALALVTLLILGGVYWYGGNGNSHAEPPLGERLTILSVSSPHAPAKITVQYDLRGLDFRQAYISYGKERVIPQRERGTLAFEAFVPLCIAVQLHVDNKILANAPVVIGTDGWEGYLSLLVPLEKESFYRNGQLYLPYHPSPSEAKEDYYPSFLNFREYGLSADAMFFEARVQNNQETGGQWAYDVSVDLIGSKHRAYFNVLSPDAILYARACVSETELNGSKNHELKALGYLMDDWCTLAMRIENQTAVIFIDGKEKLTIPYREALGDLRGIQFYFKGSGAVDWVRVTDLKDDKVKFFDDFLAEKAVTER